MAAIAVHLARVSLFAVFGRNAESACGDAFVKASRRMIR
jgi:hypothetical protein